MLLGTLTLLIIALLRTTTNFFETYIFVLFPIHNMAQVCKETDMKSQETFDAEFQQMISLIPVPQPDNQDKVANYKKAMEWLNKLYEKRKQWAARWTWQHHSAGDNRQ